MEMFRGTHRDAPGEGMSPVTEMSLREIPQNLLTFRRSHESAPGNAHRTFSLIAFPRLLIALKSTQAGSELQLLFPCKEWKTKLCPVQTQLNEKTRRGRCGSKFFTRTTSELSLHRQVQRSI